MCSLLVSGFLTEMAQQIHSLRASGVRLSHAASAFGSEVKASRKSAGTLCTTPSEISFLVIRPFQKLSDMRYFNTICRALYLSVPILQYFQQFCCGTPASNRHGLVGGCTHDFVQSAFGAVRAETL